MQVIVKGKNVEVTPALKAYSEKKAAKVGRLFARKPVEILVTLRIERELHICDVTVLVDGLILRGESRTPDMYASIDDAYDKVERRIAKHKTRLNSRLRSVGNALAEEPQDATAFEPDDEVRVTRIKKFPIKPMDAEEAVMRMELLGHDFFVYRDLATSAVNVVYKRKDGGYGLLEPED